MTDGIINVNKPAGWTSQDVCSKLRHVLHIRKIGHTGTLDPMATGVLPVCMGKATRIIEYYDRDSKSYHASMKLGITTDTLDITGEIVDRGMFSDISEKAVREAFNDYKGHVMQIPPKYSAIKIDGKRAYDLAREGKSFDIKPREIIVYDNCITGIDLASGMIEFDITCSKGTYIRTVCDDIGRSLGCGAVMTALARTASGYFKISDSYTIEEIIEASASAERNPDGAGARHRLEEMIIPADVTLEKLGKIRLNDNRVTAFLNGNSSWSKGFRITEPSEYDDLYRVYGICDNNASGPAGNGANLTFIGVGAVRNGSLIPQKVFNI